MYNDEWVTSLLLQEGKYPAKELDKRGGLTLKQEGGQLLLIGTACDLIDLADLLVSLALSGESQGQHWHIDALNLMDDASDISELILLRK